MHLEYTTRVTEAVLARLHLVIYGADSVIPDFDVADLEAQLADTMRSWGDELYEALVEELGEERAVAMYRLYGEAFPASYTHDFPARNAVSDLRRIENLPGSGGFDVNLYRCLLYTSTSDERGAAGEERTPVQGSRLPGILSRHRDLRPLSRTAPPTATGWD